jgi:hypothetical protein
MVSWSLYIALSIGCCGASERWTTTMTLLLRASGKGRLQDVRTLLRKSGAAISMLTERKRSNALMMASKHGHLTILRDPEEWRRQRARRCESSNCRSITAYVRPRLRKGHTSPTLFAELLKQDTVDVNLRDRYGTTAVLYVPVWKVTARTVRALVQDNRVLQWNLQELPRGDAVVRASKRSYRPGSRFDAPGRWHGGEPYRQIW